MKSIIASFSGFALFVMTATVNSAAVYNDLTIPPALTGTTFNLWLGQTNKQFWALTNAPLTIYSNGASKATISFKATTGTTYALKFATNIVNLRWSDVTTVTSPGSLASFVETDPARLAQSPGFYRVKMPVNSDLPGNVPAALTAQKSAALANDPICTTTPK